MCRVTQCCCCGASLETGCKILAIMGLIGGGIGLAQGVIGLVVDASGIIKIVSNLAMVIAAAMVINLVTAGLSGAVLPLVLQRLKIDPALAGGVVLTTVTDVVGFVAFLGLAATFYG